MNLTCSHYGIVLKDDSTYKTVNQTCSWLNLILAFPTTIANVSLIIALLMSSDRARPCQLLILNLAATDLLAGFANMPIQFVVFRFISQQRDPCNFANITTPFGYILGIVSFITVTSIAVERYVNVFHPFFHLSKLNSRNTGISVCILWLFGISAVMPSTVLSSSTFLNALSTFLVVVGTSINVFTYMRVLLRARKVRLQIQSEAVRFGQRRRCERDKSLLRVGGLIIVSMSICYAPIASYGLLKTFKFNISYMDYVLCWGWTLAMANSLINPIITCSFSPQIRRKIYSLWTCKIEHRTAEESRTIPSLNRVTVKSA